MSDYEYDEYDDEDEYDEYDDEDEYDEFDENGFVDLRDYDPSYTGEFDEPLLELPPSEPPTILDDISFYIEDLSYRYNVVNVVLIIAIAYVLANVISIFKVNINY